MEEEEEKVELFSVLWARSLLLGSVLYLQYIAIQSFSLFPIFLFSSSVPGKLVEGRGGETLSSVLYTNQTRMTASVLKQEGQLEFRNKNDSQCSETKMKVSVLKQE